MTDCLIAHNFLKTNNAADVNIEVKADSTGMICYNACVVPTDTITTWIQNMDEAFLCENYGTNLKSETGVLIGTPSA